MSKESVLARAEAKMLFQRKTPKTRRGYLGWIRRYAEWLEDVRPSGTHAEKMEAYLTYQATTRKVAASTQNQAFNALLYLYKQVFEVELGNVQALRAKTPTVERHAPSLEDISSVYKVLKDRNGFPVRLVFRLLYGCGLRVSEPLSIRIKDLLFNRREIVLRGAKGEKDRVVSMPPSLVVPLREQVEAARVIWQRDQANKQPCQLPNAYGRKSPRAAFEWGWFFLFPGHVPCKHPDTGEMVRYHFHGANIQRAVYDACKESGIAVRFTPHHLRHSYATHTLDSGANIHDVKECLGHENVETTMVYLHPQAHRVQSPVERLIA